MKTRIIYFASLLMVIMTMTSCFNFSSGPKPSKNKIENKAPASIVFTQGEATTVEAYGPDNYISHLVVTADNGTLSIGVDEEKYKNFIAVR